ncbi:MAG: hypothetical protein EBU46_17030 [Nitrosomonadaceae bacterium]|jgi:hypothetical protein|nr:hypothetical protein [Nitrosomonadaceae bacterium]
MVDALFEMAPMVPNVEPSDYDRSLVGYASTMVSIDLAKIKDPKFKDPNFIVMDNLPLPLTNSLWTIGLGGCGFYVFGNIRDGEISLSAAHLSPSGFRVCVSRLRYGTVVLFALVSGSDSDSGSGAACDAQADLAACVWTYSDSIEKAEIRLSDSGLELRIGHQQWEPIVAGVSRQLKDQADLKRYNASPFHALPWTELEYQPISKITSDPYLPALQVYNQIKPFGCHDLRLFRSIVRALGLSNSDEEIAWVQRIFVGLKLLD